MRYMKIDKVIPGMTVGADIIDSRDRMLLRNNTVLTESVIKLLKKAGFDYLYISDELTADVEINEAIPVALKNEINRSVKNTNIEATINNAKKVVDKILESENLSVSVYDNTENDIFGHSLAVTELSLTIAKNLSYTPEKLEDLAVVGMLHDIGKLCSQDDELLKKCNVDNVFQGMGVKVSMDEYNDRTHPIFGYRILSRNSLVKATIKQSVLTHHENVNGTGLLKLSGEKIYEYARVIRVADVFISMLSNKDNEYGVTNTSEAIEFMINQSGKMFDPQIVSTLIKKVQIYPPGIAVTLSNGMNAIVAKANLDAPTRPIIILEGGGKIDLSDRQNLTLQIVSINGNNVIEQEKHL